MIVVFLIEPERTVTCVAAQKPYRHDASL